MPEFEEGQEFDFEEFPVYMFKSFDLSPGTASGYEVILGVFTLIDPDTMDEQGMVIVIPSEDAMTVAARLRSVGATVSPIKKQLERALAAAEENANG